MAVSVLPAPIAWWIRKRRRAWHASTVRSWFGCSACRLRAIAGCAPAPAPARARRTRARRRARRRALSRCGASARSRPRAGEPAPHLGRAARGGGHAQGLERANHFRPGEAGAAAALRLHDVAPRGGAPRPPQEARVGVQHAGAEQLLHLLGLGQAAQKRAERAQRLHAGGIIIVDAVGPAPQKAPAFRGAKRCESGCDGNNHGKIAAGMTESISSEELAQAALALADLAEMVPALLAGCPGPANADDADDAAAAAGAVLVARGVRGARRAAQRAGAAPGQRAARRGGRGRRVGAAGGRGQRAGGRRARHRARRLERQAAEPAAPARPVVGEHGLAQRSRTSACPPTR